MHPLLTHAMPSKAVDAMADRQLPLDQAGVSADERGAKDPDHSFAIVFEESVDKPIQKPDPVMVAEQTPKTGEGDSDEASLETKVSVAATEEEAPLPQKTAPLRADKPEPPKIEHPKHHGDAKLAQPEAKVTTGQDLIKLSDINISQPAQNPARLNAPAIAASEKVQLPIRTSNEAVVHEKQSGTTPATPLKQPSISEQIALQEKSTNPTAKLPLHPSQMPVLPAAPAKPLTPKTSDAQATQPTISPAKATSSAAAEEIRVDQTLQQTVSKVGSKDAVAAPLTSLRQALDLHSPKTRTARSETGQSAADPVRPILAKSPSVQAFQQWTAHQPQLITQPVAQTLDTATSLDPDGYSLSRSDVATSTTVFQSHMMPGRADLLPQHMSRQIAEALQHMPNRPVEITLNPEELGRVRLGVSTSEGAITVSVFAERPETTDLMRRHISALETAFQELGYSDITFAFGGGNDAQADTQDRPHTDGDATTDALERAQPESIQLTLKSGPATGMDIRL